MGTSLYQLRKDEELVTGDDISRHNSTTSVVPWKETGEGSSTYAASNSRPSQLSFPKSSTPFKPEAASSPISENVVYSLATANFSKDKDKHPLPDDYLTEQAQPAATPVVSLFIT